jgi:hypothetical protein
VDELVTLPLAHGRGVDGVDSELPDPMMSSLDLSGSKTATRKKSA